MNPGKLYRTLEAYAQQRLGEPAFTFIRSRSSPRSYTYGELFESAEEIAQRIDERGLTTRVGTLGILLGTQEGQMLHFLAALRAGAVPSVLTPPNPKLNRDYYLRTMSVVLRRTRLSGLICDLDGFDSPTPRFQPYDLTPCGPNELVLHDSEGPLPREASFVQYSSGTTGIKRGVVVTDDAVIAQLETYADALAVTRDDIIASWLPLYHDMGFIACLNMPLFAGLHTVVLDPIEWVTKPASLLQAISNFHATLSWNPNFAYAFMAQRVRVADAEDLDLSSVRGLINCSEPVTHASQQQFLDRFREHGLRDDVFLGCYAMAETTFAVTHGEPTMTGAIDRTGPVGAARRPEGDPYISVGRPLQGVELQVVNEGGDALPDRQIGEIWVRSPFNFVGYFDESEASEQAFHDDWYRTGDLGYRLSDSWYVTGRKKDVLIIGGVNVFPSDLEELASKVDGIVSGRVAAFASFDQRMQTDRLTLLAESNLDGTDAHRAILEVRQRILAGFQVANFEVHLVPPGWLVKSSSGKMARLASREKWQQADSGAAGDADN